MFYESICAHVPVPKIEIVGESDLYVKAGSTVSLKCVITQALEEPAYIFWYHNDERVLNYDRSLVEIRMERLAPDTTVSTGCREKLIDRGSDEYCIFILKYSRKSYPCISMVSYDIAASLRNLSCKPLAIFVL